MRRFLLGSKNGEGQEQWGRGVSRSLEESQGAAGLPCRPAVQTGPLTAENTICNGHLGELTWNTRASVPNGE